MNDFDRVAAIIRYLDEHHTRQPSLGELAGIVGLSESHFHRLFQRWAGVTPKDFLQCLTAEHARQRLRESATVLDAALDAGLSGPGRLHDLMVTLEAASPGEIKTGGKGMRIEWGSAESPFGWCSLGWNDRGVCHLAFQNARGSGEPPPDLQAAWPHAICVCNEAEARRKAAGIFGARGGAAPRLKAFVRATPFQLRVWRALLRIPAGCVATYGAIATAVGVPQASRAVGAACGSNGIGYLIPCHRVIRSTGIVQGYRWGDTRKRALLAWEALRQ